MEFAIQTGIRQGEQRALMWKHIDFDKRTVRIEQAIQSNIVGNVKSKTSY